MVISIEISYFVLQNDFESPVNEFIAALSTKNNLDIKSGAMSTLISGEFEIVMKALNESIKPLLEKYPSIFDLKISNACLKCAN